MDINYRIQCMEKENVVPNMERHQRKIIKYIRQLRCTSEEVYVAGCSYAIGFTFMGLTKEGEPNENDYVHCLIGPHGRNSEKYPHTEYLHYAAAMKVVDEMLEEGIFVSDRFNKALGFDYGWAMPGPDVCPF